MRQRLIVLLSLLVAFLLVYPCSAQVSRKAGMTGASILKVGVGARAVSLGSAATTLSGDVNQVFWNPAGISIDEGKTQISFSYNRWIADLNHNAFAVSHNFGNLGTFAIAGMMSGIDGIAANRDVVPGLADVTYNTSATFDYGSMFFMLSYSKSMTDRLNLGASAKFYQETIDDQSASAFAFDFGAIYLLGYRDLTLGARINNVGSDIKYYNIAASLPMVFSFGVSMSVIQGKSFDFKGFVDATKGLDTEQLVFGGIEAKVFDTVCFRGGYKFNQMGKTDSYKSYSDGWFAEKKYNRTDEQWTVGAGIDIPYSDYIMTIDYAYTANNILRDVNRFSLTLNF